VPSEITRAGLLARGTRTTAAIMFGGGAVGALAGAARAETLPDADLAYLRLAVASELLGIDFYTKAAATRQFAGSAAANFRRALADEKAHYTALAQAQTAAGQAPAVAEDIDFAYPRGSFGSRGAIARLGARLEGIFLGIALGAAAGVQSQTLRVQLAQIAASQAQHLSAFSILTGRTPIGAAFPTSLSIDQATAALDPFES
jgi:Ferritin-like domain